MPIKKLDKEYPTTSTVVPKSFAIAGKPGRYISMEKGPIADNNPRIKTNVNRFFLCIIPC
jgi:hypothetical protein